VPRYLIIIIFCTPGSKDPGGQKQKLKTSKLERLDLGLGGCVGKYAKNGDRVIIIIILLSTC